MTTPARISFSLCLLIGCATGSQDRPRPARDERPRAEAVAGGELHGAVPAGEAESAQRGSATAPAVSAPRPQQVVIPPLGPWNKRDLERIRAVQRHVHFAARKYGIPADLINGVIWVESKFIVEARGQRGPRGLMQVMPRTGRWIAQEIGRTYRPHSASFNVEAGTFYLARMLERFDGDLDLALAAYNVGPGVIDQVIENSEPLPEYSRRYIGLVRVAAQAFQDRFPPVLTDH